MAHRQQDRPGAAEPSRGRLGGASAGAARSVRVCFGRRWVWPELLGRLQAGSVLELDSEASSTAEIYADGRLAGRGSAVVVGGRLCIRLEQKASPAGEEGR
jgi:flagellar motor switch protein FliM